MIDPELPDTLVPDDPAVAALLAQAQAYLHQHDPDLRIRCSVERPGYFVTERRCRRAPAVNTGMPGISDMHVQARDGYIHVSLTHVEWLHHPWNIVIALHEEGFDTWAFRDADQVDDEFTYEETWARETRRRRRQDDGRAYYREAFDILSRCGNVTGRDKVRSDVTRWNNPGLPSAAPVIEAPATAA